MADTSVKYLHSGMAGAPVLAGQVGSMIALLDACLVNGFGSGTVDSVVIAGGIATVTRGAGHPAEAGTVMLIAGATVAGGSINGEQKVLTVAGNTYTFDATGLANQTATGTITHKVAPLAWNKPFSGTNLAAYRSADPESTGMYLRVDDTATTQTRVVGYESMTGINDNLIGPFPTPSQISGGGWWAKSDAANASARPWVLVGDGRFFYLAVATVNTGYSPMSAFGDFIPTRSGDPYACLLNCHPSSVGSTGNATEYHSWDATTSSNGTYVSRPYTGLGQGSRLKRVPNTLINNSTSGYSGATSQIMPYPNFSDGGFYVCEHNLFDSATNVLRGRSPGFYHLPQQIGINTFAQGAPVSDVAGLPGRTLRILSSTSDAFGCWAYDATGPWR